MDSTPRSRRLQEEKESVIDNTMARVEKDPSYLREALSFLYITGWFAFDQDNSEYVTIETLPERKRIGFSGSWKEARSWAWGYLDGRGAKINDGQEVLLSITNGPYEIIAAGCVKTAGEDYERVQLAERVAAAQRELEHYDKKLSEEKK